MSKKQNLDDFLRSKLSELPDGPNGGFHKVESQLNANSNKGIAVLLLIPLLMAGLYWVSTLSERDLIVPTKSIANPSIQKVDEEIRSEGNLELKQSDGVIATGVEASDKELLSQTQNLEVVQRKPSNKVQQESSKTLSASSKAIAERNSNDAYSNGVVSVKDEPLEQTLAAADTLPMERFVGEEETVVDNKTDYVLSPSALAAIPVVEEQSSGLDFEPDVREESKWSVTLNIYPNYTFREFKINPNYASQVNERYEGIIRESEKGGYAFNAGIDVRYHLGNNVFLGSGLGFIQTKINGSYNFDVYDEPVFDDNGNIYMYAVFLQPIEVNQGIIQTYRYAQIPLHVSYQPWVSEKLRLIVEGGFSYIRFISADGTTIDHQNLFPKDLSTMSFNKNIASMDFKVGMTYYPTPNLAFGLEPTLLYFNSSIYSSNQPVYVVPWSVGVNFNLRLKLF